MLIRVITAVVLLSAATSAPADGGDAAGADRESIQLNPVVVTATRLPEPLRDVPASISVIERSDIQDAQDTVSLAAPLNRVPGVFVQDSGNFAQDARIQIRGFGARSAFGVRDIRVLVDGIPETLPDGQTGLDNLDLGAVDHIEVLRGPASSLYGNASGGVIQFFTADGPDTPQAEARLVGGSYGLQKYQVSGSGKTGNVRLFVHSSFLQTDGFRDHSAARSGIVNAKLRYQPNERSDVTILLNGVDAPQADDPGGLTRAEADAHPSHASALNRQLDAGEAVEQGRVAAVAHHRMQTGELSGYAYLLYRDFENKLPVPPTVAPVQGGIVTFHRFSPGGGVRYLFDAPVCGWPQEFTAGADVQYQDDARRRFVNQNGERGALGLQQDEQVASVGPYVREAVELFPDLEVSAGVRYDSVHYDVDVDVPSSNGSATRTLDAWSPAGGVRYSPQTWLSLFANVGTAFQVPTTTELANPNGAGFNPELRPQHATSYEIGGRTEWERLRAGVAVFYLDLTDVLIPYDQQGRTFYRNAGGARRYGSELDGQATLLPHVEWTSAVSLLRAEFHDGREEPGIPGWQVYNELAYRHASGLFAAVEAFVADGFVADDAHSARARGYELCNLRAGYTWSIGNWTVAPFVGVDNLVDEHYDARVRINAQAGRFFEPAPGINVRGGVTVSAML